MDKPNSTYLWEKLSHTDTSEQPYWCERPFPALDLIQGQPRRSLDIGCSAGYASMDLKKRFPNCKTYGVEPNVAAAKEASKRVDKVFNAYAEQVDWQAEDIGDGFDVILLFDVLEHMYDPWGSLRFLHQLCHQNTEIIVNLPNAAHIRVMADMAAGFFPYQSSGLLDITHIRFYTDYEALKMYYQTGYQRSHHTAFMDNCHAEFQAALAAQNQSFPQWLEMGKCRILVESADELVRICTVSNVSRLLPANPSSFTAFEQDLISTNRPASFTQL